MGEKLGDKGFDFGLRGGEAAVGVYVYGAVVLDLYFEAENVDCFCSRGRLCQ